MAEARMLEEEYDSFEVHPAPGIAPKQEAWEEVPAKLTANTASLGTVQHTGKIHPMNEDSDVPRDLRNGTKLAHLLPLVTNVMAESGFDHHPVGGKQDAVIDEAYEPPPSCLGTPARSDSQSLMESGPKVSMADPTGTGRETQIDEDDSMGSGPNMLSSKCRGSEPMPEDEGGIVSFRNRSPRWSNLSKGGNQRSSEGDSEQQGSPSTARESPANSSANEEGALWSEDLRSCTVGENAETATQVLDQLKALTPYVPQLLLRKAARELEGASEKETEERFTAAVMVADITGFTPLTERALTSKRGTEVVEELTVCINNYFSEAIEMVLQYGGDIIKFAGDAMIVCFPVDWERNESQSACALRAAACGFDLVSTLGAYTPQLGGYGNTSYESDAEKVSGSSIIRTVSTECDMESTGEGPVRVLVVDDITLNRVVLSKMLIKLNCEVVHATNGKEAVEAFQKTPFPIVFMDLLMPVMDGYEAARAIRRLEDPRMPSAYISAVTARIEDEAKNGCLEAGMNDFLMKPITMSHLLNIIKSKANRKPASQPSSPVQAPQIKNKVMPSASSQTMRKVGMHLGGPTGRSKFGTRRQVKSNHMDAIIKPDEGAPMTLSLKVMVGMGEVLTLNVGGETQVPSNQPRWEYFIADTPSTGNIERDKYLRKPIDQIRRADDHAKSGDVILSPEAWSLIQFECEGEALREGFIRLNRILGKVCMPDVPKYFLPQRNLAPTVVKALSNYLPDMVRTKIEANPSGGSMMLAEIRRLTCLFLGLPSLSNFDEKNPSQLARVQVTMTTVQQCLRAYEGCLTQFRMDEKGYLMICAFGLPGNAHEDDPLRGVQCALTIRDSLKAVNEMSVAGVTTGKLLCATVGGKKRCEYTVYGDPINLSARFMKKAHDEVLADLETYNLTKETVEYTVLPPIPIKGKTGAIDVFRPIGIKGVDGQVIVPRLMQHQGIIKPNLTKKRTEQLMLGRANELKSLLNHVEILKAIHNATHEQHIEDAINHQQQLANAAANAGLNGAPAVEVDAFGVTRVRAARVSVSGVVLEAKGGEAGASVSEEKKWGCVVVMGQGGIGKSRLLEGLKLALASSRVQVIVTSGTAARTTQVFGPWARLVLELLNFPPEKSAEERGHAVLQLLEPQWQHLGYLLNDILKIMIREGSSTVGVDGQQQPSISALPSTVRDRAGLVDNEDSRISPNPSGLKNKRSILNHLHFGGGKGTPTEETGTVAGLDGLPPLPPPAKRTSRGPYQRQSSGSSAASACDTACIDPAPFDCQASTQGMSDPVVSKVEAATGPDARHSGASTPTTEELVSSTNPGSAWGGGGGLLNRIHRRKSYTSVGTEGLHMRRAEDGNNIERRAQPAKTKNTDNAPPEERSPTNEHRRGSGGTGSIKVGGTGGFALKNMKDRLKKDNTGSERSSAELRTQRISLMLRQLILSLVTVPCVIIIEDAHLLDGTSWLLLKSIGEQVNKGVLVVVACRPLEPSRAPREYTRVMSSKHTTTIHLRELSMQACNDLVCQSICGVLDGVKGIPDSIFVAIYAKTHGHPLFTEQMASTLVEKGIIIVDPENQRLCHVPSGTTDLTGFSFSHSMEALITSRVDLLKPTHALILKVASVIGLSFEKKMLLTVLNHQMERDSAQPLDVKDLEEAISSLDQLNLITLDPSSPDVSDPHYMFSNSVTRDVTYDMLPHRQRRTIHMDVAQEFESRDPAGKVLGVSIAEHYTKACRDVEEMEQETTVIAIRHWEIAADDAYKKFGQYALAIHYYKEAINLANILGDNIDYGGERRARWHHNMASSCVSLGDMNSAWEACLTAIQFMGEKSLPIPPEDQPANYRYNPPGNLVLIQTGCCGHTMAARAWRSDDECAELSIETLCDQDRTALRHINTCYQLSALAAFKEDMETALFAGRRCLELANRMRRSLSFLQARLQARAYSILAMMADSVSHSETLATLSLQLLETAPDVPGTRSQEADIHFNIASAHLVHGKWRIAEGHMDIAMGIYADSKGQSQVDLCRALKGLSNLCQGRMEVCEKEGMRLVEECKDHQLLQKWGLALALISLFMQHKHAHAYEFMRPYIPSHDIKSPLPLVVSLLWALACEAEWHSGNKRQAVDSALTLAEKMKSWHLLSGFFPFAIGSLCEVLLLSVDMNGISDNDKRTRLKVVEALLLKLKRITTRTVFAKVHRRFYEARMWLAEGHASAARKRFGEAYNAARALRMTSLEQACAAWKQKCH